MNNVLALIAMFFNLLLPQNVVRIQGGSNGGTPPTFNAGNITTCAAGTQNCGSPVAWAATAGDTIYMVATGDPSPSTLTVSDPSSDTFSCGSTHSFGGGGGAVVKVCSAVTAGWIAGGGIYACARSTNTFWVACAILSVHCVSTCVIEQGPTYADTSGTGGSKLMTAGSITTSFQANELILGGFVTNQSGGGSTGTPAAGTSFTIPNTNCPGGQGCGYAQSTPGSGGSNVIVEYQNVTALGTYAATITEPTSQDTMGFTMAVR